MALVSRNPSGWYCADGVQVLDHGRVLVPVGVERVLEVGRARRRRSARVTGQAHQRVRQAGARHPGDGLPVGGRLLGQRVGARQQRAAVEEGVGPAGRQAGDLRAPPRLRRSSTARPPRPRCRCPRWPARKPSSYAAPKSSSWTSMATVALGVLGSRAPGRTSTPRASTAKAMSRSATGSRGCPRPATRWLRTRWARTAR